LTEPAVTVTVSPDHFPDRRQQVSYDDVGVRVMKDRAERRRELSVEERRTEALEQIADTLFAMEDALQRLADKG
jgi:hypothetical protein